MHYTYLSKMICKKRENNIIKDSGCIFIIIKWKEDMQNQYSQETTTKENKANSFLGFYWLGKVGYKTNKIITVQGLNKTKGNFPAMPLSDPQ